MKITVSLELFNSVKESDSLVSIKIDSLPVSNRHLVGSQIEKLVFEQYQSALRLYFKVENNNGTLQEIITDNLE